MKTNTMITKRILLIASALVASTVLLSNSNDENFLRKNITQETGFAPDLKKPNFEPDEIVIKFKKEVPSSNMAAKTVSFGLKLNEVSPRPHFTTGFLSKNETLDQAIVRLQQDPSVEFVEPKYKYYKTAVAPNDTDFGKLWGLQNSGQTISSPSYSTNNPGTSGKDMKVLGAWDLTTDCNSKIVAVLDTGINYAHEDLAGNMWDGSTAAGGCVDQNGNTISGGCPNHGWDFASNDNNPRDEDGHGSHVAGTIGAVGNNNKGISGVCQSAKLMAVRVLGISGGDNTTVSNGIYFAVRNGAKVINMSLGGDNQSSLIDSAIEYARANGALVVVAAGNDTRNLNSGASFPCKNTNVNLICIAALDQSYTLANFSNFDTNTTVANRHVDFGAPGTNIYSLFGTEVTYDEATSGHTGWTTTGSGGSYTWINRNCSGFNILTIPNDCTLYDWALTSTNVYATELDPNMWRGVYKTFTIPSGATNIQLSHQVVAEGKRHPTISICNDYGFAMYRAGSSEPLPGDGAYLSFRNQRFPNDLSTSFFCEKNGFPFVSFYESDFLSNCLGNTQCSVGYRYSSNNDGTTWGGMFVRGFKLYAWAPSNNSYGNYDGTSMATPNVAGVAALIWAYNPSFTFTEVIQKLIDGGQTETALTGTTRYGKAINANDSIKHLKQVTGVSVSLQ